MRIVPLFAAAAVVALAAASLFVRRGQALYTEAELPLSRAPGANELVEMAAPLVFKSPAETALESLREAALEFSPAGFVQAAGQGSVSQVQLFLTAGIAVDETDPSGRTALRAACEAGDVSIARLLIASGAGVNTSDGYGFTPLLAAVKAGGVTLLEELLRSGAELNAADANGRTALMHAAADRQIAIGNALLDQQPDVSLRDVQGEDAFTLSVRASGDSPLTRKILAAGESRKTWTAAAREALFLAIRSRDAEGVRLYLTKHEPAPTLDDGRQTLLAYTLAWNDLDQLRMLLECGADPNAPISVPVEKEYISCFEGKMLPHYLTEERNMTPLMIAAGLGRADFVKLLVDHGARVHAVTAKHKIAPLSFAAWAKDVPSQLVLLGRPPRIEDQPTRIRISLGDQRAYVYQGNEIMLTTAVSTGRAGFRTPTGEFVVTDKHISRMSSLYKVPMPFFMRLSCSDVGMHAGVVPGYPASHGCVRMPREKVQKLFKIVSVGTPVTIVH